jgi:hypothetical protein
VPSCTHFAATRKLQGVAMSQSRACHAVDGSSKQRAISGNRSTLISNSGAKSDGDEHVLHERNSEKQIKNR